MKEPYWHVDDKYKQLVADVMTGDAKPLKFPRSGDLVFSVGGAEVRADKVNILLSDGAIGFDKLPETFTISSKDLPLYIDLFLTEFGRLAGMAITRKMFRRVDNVTVDLRHPIMNVKPL